VKAEDGGIEKMNDDSWVGGGEFQMLYARNAQFHEGPEFRQVILDFLDADNV
jgi:hypothetical protein